MSLKVWLPLDKDTKNYGISNIDKDLSYKQLTQQTTGKIGNCYNKGNIYHLSKDIIDNQWTVCFWFKQSQFADYNDILLCKNTSVATDAQFYISAYNNGTKLNVRINGSEFTGCPYTFDINTWYHIAVSYDGNNWIAYVNGIVLQSGTTTIAKVNALNLGIGTRSGNAAGTSCSSTETYKYLNDVRIYDECLSSKQIKEISKGLICHYKFDNVQNSRSLILNGFGELGNTGWSSSNVSTTEIPSGVSGVKASFYNGNATNVFTPIIPKHSYTFDMYVKSSGATSGYTYPSIYPYDIDKKMIDHFDCASGFWTESVTTLTQPLNPGDTVIHAANLSGWSTGDNYGYHVAIFGYADSTGYVYPDLEFTQDTPIFGTKTDKSHIDKTNNTITLNSAFTGKARPVGTKICQSTEGGTYYYPFGQLNLANLSNWTHYNTTFVPYYASRLKYAKYWKYSTYSNTYQAAISLIDNNFNKNEVSDDSGFSHSGVINGNLTFSDESDRYKKSLIFDGNSYCQTQSPSTEVRTISFWAKWKTIPSGQSVVFMDYKSKIGFGIYSGGLLCSSNAVSSKAFIKANIVANQWYHFVIVNPDNINTSTNRKLYINGVEQTPTSNTSNWTYELDYLQVGKRSTTSDGFNGQISDFRMYVTALSDDDIKQLYNTSAFIDDKNNMMAYEFVEE